MFGFDRAVHQYVTTRGGKYYRYSDDLLIVRPGDEQIAYEVEEYCKRAIKTHCATLDLHPNKNLMTEFYLRDGKRHYKHLTPHSCGNGIEYLGFRYDGCRVYLRDKTVSRFYRKVSSGINRRIKNVLKSDPCLSKDEIREMIHPNWLKQQFMKKMKFKSSDYRSWTFYSYAKKAIRVFGERKSRVRKQLRGFDEFFDSRLTKAIDKHTSKIRKQTVD